MKNSVHFVVFLDVDGVLNTRRSCVSSPSGLHVGIDEARIVLLADAMKETGAEGVVLTTTWKNMKENDEDYIYLINLLETHGIKVFGKTEEKDFTKREDGVLAYLESHPEIEEFVILDDQHFGFENYNKIWEGFIDTQGRGIEYSVPASVTPSISVMLFVDAIKKFA